VSNRGAVSVRGKTLPNSDPPLFFTPSLQSSFFYSSFVSSLFSRAPETNGKTLEINFRRKPETVTINFSKKLPK